MNSTLITFNGSDFSSTNTTARQDYTEPFIKGFLILCSFYLLLVASIFLIRMKKKRKLLFVSQSHAKDYVLASVVVLLLISTLSLVRNVAYGAGVYWKIEMLSNIATSLNALKTANMACAVITGIGDFSLTMGVGLVYLFLWLRQRIFYVCPPLKSLTSKYVTFISNAILFVWALYYVIIFIAFAAFIRFEFKLKTANCVVKTKFSKRWFRAIIISWIGSSIFMQLVLLGLFVYPLLKQASWRKDNNVNNSFLLVRVKRAVALTSISLLSDIIAFLLPAVLDYGLTTVYNINLIINNLVVIGYFDCWKTILLPCKKQLANQIDRSSLGSVYI